jgi:phenylalanyl-tRNA synthetase alpha chain
MAAGKELHALEKKLLLALKDGPGSPEELVGRGGFGQQVEVMNAASWLKSKGLVEIRETGRVWHELGEEGRRCLKEGLPETRALKILAEEGDVDIRKLADVLGKVDAAAATGVLKLFGAQISRAKLRPLDMESLSKEVERNQALLRDLDAGRPGDEEVIRRMANRGDILRRRDRFDRVIALSSRGADLLTGEFVDRLREVRAEVSQLTPELLQSGKWKGADIRPYDVNRFAPAVHSAKRHPIRGIEEEVRRAFLDMGFEEIRGEVIQPAFWNFDALFVPQDHPARDSHDSFFVEAPPASLDEERARKVGAAHRGEAHGSKGWGPTWSKEEASRLMLKTHNTALTIKWISEHGAKLDRFRVFTIGKNFRRDAMDSTHLPEFIQFEGIVTEEGCNFGMLVGLLREFYRRVGVADIKLKPGYFPFTEPSAEFLMRFQGKWMEGGGCGVFRPEVTEPWGCKHPVIAWGMGLERLAMVRYGIEDIRKIYYSDIDFLRSRPLR